MKQKIHLHGWFAIMALILIMSIGMAFWTGRRAIQSYDQVTQQDTIILRLGNLLSTMKDLETSQRDYLLTGNEAYLEPYRFAESSVQSELAQLEKARPVGSLRQQIESKLLEMAETISVRRAQGLQAALASVSQDSGKKLQDAIRTAILKFTAQETAKRSSAAGAMRKARQQRNTVFSFAILSNLAFLVWMHRKTMATIRASETAALETERQRQVLATTLASIGDAVILTDTDAHIVFLNRVAEKLTGWSAAEAKGQPCAKVFHIINEASRLPVESPVEKVLQTGLIVGLANHTLLISKDGSELPIDDCGAPVREPGGELHGVVLVFRDFSAYKKAEKEKQTAKEAVENASRAKDTFLAMLSHELRTPLTPVLALLSHWEGEDDLPAQWKADMQMIRRNVMLEARLIDDLLDLTRISRGTLSLNKERVNLHDLADATVQMFAANIKAKSLDVTVKLSAENPWVFGDPARLQQVLWNIMSNAVKFTPAHGRIQIESRQTAEGDIAVQVTDTGIGISEKTLGHLFSPFEKDCHEGSKFGGLGLGMAISKALADWHEGKIQAQSAGVGQGASFTFTIPVLSGETTPPLTDLPLIVYKTGPLRILLVEDHGDTALALSRLLSRDGHQVSIGASLAQASTLVRGQAFDFLISDIGLPDGTGLDLIRLVRTFSTMPAIALTGYGMRENIAACHESGFQTHLTKPVSIQQLRAEIAALWAKHGGQESAVQEPRP